MLPPDLSAGSALIEAISLVDCSPQKEKIRRKYFSKMLVLSVAIFANNMGKVHGSN